MAVTLSTTIKAVSLDYATADGATGSDLDVVVCGVGGAVVSNSDGSSVLWRLRCRHHGSACARCPGAQALRAGVRWHVHAAIVTRSRTFAHRDCHLFLRRLPRLNARMDQMAYYWRRNGFAPQVFVDESIGSHVMDPNPDRSSGRLSSPTLVGRGDDLATLVDAVVHAPAVVLIEGEAGVGKSRIVAELELALRQYSPRSVLRTGHCHPQRHPFPLEAVIEALHDVSSQLDGASLGAVTGVLRDLLPELAHRLPPSPAIAGDPAAQTHQVFRALREVLGALGPTVLVLEDLHWADDATVELLHFLVTSPPPALSLVLTYRGEEVAESSALRSLASRVPAPVTHARIVLSPLDARGVASLIAGILEVDEVSEEFAEYVHARTAGLPFAVEEVLRLLKDRKDLIRRGDSWARRRLESVEVPSAIRDAILERLFRLSPHARVLVEAAAVVRHPTPGRTLGDIADLPEAEADVGLAEALSSALLQEARSAMAGFRHDLARQAVYEAIPGPQRRHLHLRAGQVLEEEGSTSSARLAQHFSEAGDVDNWAKHAERAAEDAMARHDPAGATAILVELLGAAAVPAPEQVRLARALGYAALAAGRPGEAVAVVNALVEDGNLDDRNRGELRLLLANLLLGTREPDAAREQVRRSILELADAADLRALALRVLAYPHGSDGDVATYLAWMDEAERAAVDASDQAVVDTLRWDRATVLIAFGDPQGWKALEELSGLAADSDASPLPYRARCMSRMASAAALAGHYVRASEVTAAGIALCEQQKFVPPLPMLEATKSYLLWVHGRLGQLEIGHSEPLHEGDSESPPAVLLALVVSLLRLLRGGPDAAQAGLEETMERARAENAFAVFAAAAAALGRCHLLAARPAAALEAMSAALALVRAQGVWVWGIDLVAPAVEARVALGRAEEAIDLISELSDGLTGRDVPAAEPSLLLARGLLEEAAGRVAEAASCFDAAAAAWADLQRPYEAALARERAGRALIHLDRSGAVDRLTSALAVESLGAEPDGARIRRFLAEQKVRLPYPWRGGRRSLGDKLSQREEEVLSLANQGHTYPEIGMRLGLSPRTVEGHLAKARRKQRNTGRGRV